MIRLLLLNRLHLLHLSHQLQVFLVQATILLQLHKEWVFLARWQDLATILLQQTKVCLDLVNQAVQVDLVQLVPVALHVQVDHLDLLVLVELLVQVDLLLVLAEHLVVHQLEHLVLVLLEVVQVLAVAVAAVALLELSVRVAHAAHRRLESLRE
jgi:hypothetical protein